jgi:hypothetical protein
MGCGFKVPIWDVTTFSPANIFRRIAGMYTKCILVFALLAHFSTLKMEVILSSETLVNSTGLNGGTLY